jgi:hypothetical protein
MTQKRPNARERRQSKSRSESGVRTTKAKAWLIGILAAALATIITGWIVAAPGWVKEKVAPSSPITFSVQRELDYCLQYIVPNRIGDISEPPANNEADPTAWSKWAISQGGADLSASKVLVTIRGTTKSPVTVTGVKIHVVERKPALTGSKVANGCGGTIDARYAEFDLDSNPPRISSSSSIPVMWGGEEWRATPLKFPYEVTDTESESLLIIGSTKEYAAWTASLLWTDGNKSGVEKIDFKGKPFRTSDSKNATDYVRVGTSWKTAAELGG